MSTGPFTLPELPYSDDALAPHISARTLGFHHGKHHAGYVEKVNALVAGTELAEASLEELIKTVAKDRARKELFNPAAQAWNHSFSWRSMRPKGGGQPGRRVLAALEQSFGSLAGFKERFQEAATGHFGSGWAWLVQRPGGLEVATTHDADLPLAYGERALFTCDLWEHAYYLDHQDRRAEYVTAFLDHLVDWGFAEQNLG